MKVADIEFVRSAAGPRDFPRDDLPQVAMVGRSNVGKSSLINALAKRVVARTSGAPGKTRLLNIYRVRLEGGPPSRLYLVDLPGYGFARGARAEGGFEALVGQYFAHPPTGGRDAGRGPAAALMVVDSRHPGLAADVAALDWIVSQGRPVVVAASKIDKLTRAERQRAEREWTAALGVPIVPVSATTGEGLDELWKRMRRLLSGPSGPGRAPTPTT